MSKSGLALLAIPLGLFLIAQNWRFTYALAADRANIETHQARIRYLTDKLEALAHLDARDTPTPEIRSVAELRRANDDGTFTITKIIDVMPKQLPAKLVITSAGDGILSMTVRPQKLENRIVYWGVVWLEPSEPSLMPQHHVEIEYPIGRYAVEVTSKNDGVTLDYKFAR